MGFLIKLFGSNELWLGQPFVHLCAAARIENLPTVTDS